MQNSRLSAIIIAKSIAEEFSDAADIGSATAEILAAAEMINAFLNGLEIVLEEEDEDEDAEIEVEIVLEEEDEDEDAEIEVETDDGARH